MFTFEMQIIGLVIEVDVMADEWDSFLLPYQAQSSSPRPQDEERTRPRESSFPQTIRACLYEPMPTILKSICRCPDVVLIELSICIIERLTN